MVGTARCAVRENRAIDDTNGRRSAASLPTVLAIEPGDLAFRFTIGRALLQISAFIMRDFTLGYADLGFQFPVFPVEAQDNEGAAGDSAEPVKLVNLLAVKKKLSHALGCRDFVAGALVRLNIGVIKKRFAFFDADESVGDVRLPGPNRFDLAALELDAGFVALENVKIAERFAVEDRLGRHKRASGRAAKLSGAVGGSLGGQLVSEFAGDDFAQRDVGERRTWSCFDERTMA